MPQSFDQTVDHLFAEGYPQSVVTTLNAMGDNALGFRLAGSPAEHEAADYLAAEFAAMGLSRVRREAAPVDAWTLRGAAVRIGGRNLLASQFPGIPGTDGPLTADLLYVGRGTASDYDGTDVTGKFALIDIEEGEFWFNLQGHEAQVRGAVGVIFTNGANTHPFHATADGLATSESRWNVDGVPAVFVSTRDGAWIKTQLEEHSVTATVTSQVQITRHDFTDPPRGGVGYNVVAELPGTNPEAKAILIAAHYDAYFRSALDNTGAVAQMMTIARAMATSGTRLERSIIFLASCGEEYGYVETQYSYLAGAWYAATVTHSSAAPDPDDRWTGPLGRIGLFLNLEESPQRGAPLGCGATTDLLPWIASLGDSLADELLPNGFAAHEPYSVWHDGATFTCAGVPTVVTVAEGTDYPGFNHTTDDDVALIDYDYMSSLVKFYQRVLSAASTGIAPHDPDAQAAHLNAVVSEARLTAAGADPRAVDRFVTALRAYSDATAAFAVRRPGIARKRWNSINQKLSALQVEWHTNLSGIDAEDSHINYPFQQSLADIEHLRAALAHLKPDAADASAALDELKQVGLTSIGLLFSPEVYQRHLQRYLPDHPLLTWGGQVNQFWHIDLTPIVGDVLAGRMEAARDSVEAVLTGAIEGIDVPGAQSAAVHIDGLNERLAHAATVLEHLTPLVGGLQ